MSRNFDFTKQEIWEAWKSVKSNGGNGGVDGVTLANFEQNIKGNLYKVWNRMSSGSYFPPMVRGVEIPKKSGGNRLLGIPTIADRVAQTVVQRRLERRFEPIFLPDSYGYRPNKSATDAVRVTRDRCWKMDWVLEFDVRGLFDNIPHQLLMKALHHHSVEPCVILYVERWLQVSIQLPDGRVRERKAGTPQGGCVSPVLANLFMHYVFDVWMSKRHPGIPWCRYADDGLAHCRSHAEAEKLLVQLQQRFLECGLELHPEKTRIVYCGRPKYADKGKTEKFKFLGFEFRRRIVINQRDKSLFQSFSPAISPEALNSVRDEIRQCFRRLGTHCSLAEVARFFNPKIRGWWNYYGQFHRSQLVSLANYFNNRLVIWIRHKSRRMWGTKTRPWKWLRHRYRENPKLFVHWKEINVCPM